MFKRLNPSDYPQLLPYFKKQTHRLCYYSLSSCIAWKHRISNPVWFDDGGTLFIGMDYLSSPLKNYLLLPFNQGVPIPPAQLHAYALKFGFKRYLNVPEDYIALWPEEDLKRFFTIRQDPRYDDYIYRTEDLASLKGKKYSKKRNLIHQFLKSHVDQGRVDILPLTIENIDECLDFLCEWTQIREMESPFTQSASIELQATVNALRNLDSIGFKGALMRIDGKVKAFGLGSKLTDEIGGFNFEKAAPDIKGLYQYFDQQCVRMLFKNFPLINKECDLGEPGIRHSKRSYYPVAMVKSYEITIQ
jgi:hypothetical protein